MVTQPSLARFLMHPTRYRPVRMMLEMGVRQMPARDVEWIRQSAGKQIAAVRCQPPKSCIKKWLETGRFHDAKFRCPTGL